MIRNFNSGLSISSSEYLMFCKQLVIPWWYSEWSWSGFRDSVICTNLIILQSWHPSGLVSSVPRPGELFVPMLLLRQGGCALTHNYDGEYCVSKTYSETKEKYVQQRYKHLYWFKTFPSKSGQMISKICWCVAAVWREYLGGIFCDHWLGWPDEMVMIGHGYADKWGVVTR